MAIYKQLPQVHLQTKEHDELLNVIDKIRSLGISHFVDLPQVIVCGDQSSGKSSVLEAVSGIRFPVQANLCTRVATELILRRTTETRTAVSIVPSRDRSDAEFKKLEKWGSAVNDTSDFPQLVNDAMAAMGVNKADRPFSEDILRVEHSGPTQPALTLVDLPGLFHAATQEQSTKDKELVTKLVTSYMNKSRSIILAVITAKNDIAGQVVLDRIRKIDPAGNRSMGIITKPDTLEGVDDKERFLKLAENKEIKLHLGWHVLRNRDPRSIDCSTEERDRKEADFFAADIWRTLPLSQVGIGSLRPRLSQILMDQITTELPGLIEDVETGIEESKSRLSRLGESRQTLQEQRMYLLRISQAFSTLMKSAIDGLYTNAFFGDALSDEGYSRRLRAVVRNTLADFAKDLRVKGDTHVIRDDDTRPQDVEWYQVSITRTEWLAKVQKLMSRTKGCELPGMFNPQIIGDLFFEQSQSWQMLARDYAKLLFDATRTTIELIIDNVTDATIREGISRQILNPSMTLIQRDLNAKIEEVLLPQQRGHPITYNHYLIDNIQKARQNRLKDQMLHRVRSYFGRSLDEDSPGTFTVPFNYSIDSEALVEALAQTTEVDMDRFACKEATDVMQAYYKVAMKKFVDDFSVLAIEERLLQKLPNILSPEAVMLLDDDVAKNIAAETEESRAERTRATEKLQGLQMTLDILRRLDHHRSTNTDLDEDVDLDNERSELGFATESEASAISEPAESTQNADFDPSEPLRYEAPIEAVEFEEPPAAETERPINVDSDDASPSPWYQGMKSKSKSKSKNISKKKKNKGLKSKQIPEDFIESKS